MKRVAVCIFFTLALLLSGCLNEQKLESYTIEPAKKTVREENEEIARKAYEAYLDGADYWESVEPNIQPLVKNCVYWVPDGKCYHSTPDCVALLKSETIYHGPLYEAKEKGKTDPCSKCVGD